MTSLIKDAIIHKTAKTFSKTTLIQLINRAINLTVSICLVLNPVESLVWFNSTNLPNQTKDPLNQLKIN